MKFTVLAVDSRNDIFLDRDFIDAAKSYADLEWVFLFKDLEDVTLRSIEENIMASREQDTAIGFRGPEKDLRSLYDHHMAPRGAPPFEDLLLDFEGEKQRFH